MTSQNSWVTDRRYLRPLVGAATILSIGAIVALALALFRGGFTTSIPVMVISQRAGLVMNPDAKVKMRGVVVGRVSSIERRRDGTAAIHLELDRAQREYIPANVGVDIASTTVFGAKFVQLIPPTDPAKDKVHSGQVIDGEHVTVEINTVFEQFTSLLSAIEPEKLNQTLSTLASALNGRGRHFGETISNLNAALGVLEPSYPALAHDLAVMPAVLDTYADAMPDLLSIVNNVTDLGNTVVSERQNLDAVLVSVIGLANTGNDVLGSNREPLTDVLRLLSPVTGLTDTYNRALYCGIAGTIPLAKLPPSRSPGAEVLASFQWGVDPYRYPSDLPRVAAKGGPQCVGLPRLPYETRPPYVVADVGTNQFEYGNRGIVLNTTGMKEFLLGRPLDGTPRNTAQIGQPG